jgi:hypothetical protein
MNHFINSLQRNNNKTPKEAHTKHKKGPKLDQKPHKPGLTNTTKTQSMMIGFQWCVSTYKKC